MAGVVDRYRLEERLGSGGGGEVFRARDDATGTFVALKLVPFERAGEEALHAEFEVASSLRHPNIVLVREYGFTGDGKSYFTMDVVDGLPIVDHQIDLDLATLYRLGSQLCSALSYLHGRGLLHGDLKPSNVMVVGRGNDAQVKLLDFGLARHRKGPQNGAGGTMGYMAPETVVSGRADVRSELYSLGAVLYHVVTQAPPVGYSAEDFDRALIGAGLPPVAQRAPDLDPGWAHLIDRLVAKEPGARPISAVEVQEMLDAWAESHGTERIGPPVLEVDRPTPPIGGAFVGRHSELEIAAEVVAGARAGQGALLFLHGEAGIGKTRLLEEVRGRAQLDHVRVLWARCGGPDTRPFSVASQLVRQLESSLSVDLAGRYREAIGVLCGDGTPMRDAAPADARLRILSAAASLVLDASGHEPLAVIVDDVHAADHDAIDFLRALAVRVAGARVAVVCAGRDEALPGGLRGDLEGEDFVRTTRLERLGPAAVRELVVAALGEVEADRSSAPPELPDAVLRASGGNPLLAEEALRSWVDIGGLVRARGTWVLRPDIVRNAARPTSSVQEAIAARLDRLDVVPRQVLVAASALGDAFDAPFLAELTGVPLDRVESALGGLVARNLLRTDGAHTYRFSQGLVGEFVYERTPPDERTLVHARALQILLARRESGVELDALARHALAARDTEHGPTLCLEAALDAERACALDRAIEWYIGLLSLSGEAAGSSWLHEKIADMALATGRSNLARASLESALELAPANERLRLRRKRAEAQLLGGDPRRARAECDEALTQEGDSSIAERLPTEIVRIRALHRTGELDLALSSADDVIARARAAGREDDWAAAQMLRSTVLALRGDPGAAIVAVRAVARTARASGDGLTLARAHGELGMCYGMLGRSGRALAAARAARRTYAAIGAVTDLWRSHNAIGLAALSLGRWDEAEREFQAYALAAEMFGNRWGRTEALTNQSILARERGDLSLALRLAERSGSFGERWGLKWLTANALQQAGITRLRMGDTDGARVSLEQARKVATAVDAGGLLLAIDVSLVELALDTGDLDGARLLGETTLQTAVSKGALGEKQATLVLLARTCRRQGRLEQAQTLLEQACEEISRGQAPLQFARAQLERAQVLRERAELAGAQHLADAARTAFQQLGALQDLGLAERLLAELRDTPEAAGRSLRNLQALLDASRTLAGVVDLQDLLDKVIDQILSITGAERGCLLLVEPVGAPRVRVARNLAAQALESAELQGSRSVVEEVARTGRSTCVTEVADDLRFRTRRGGRELGLRSLMCVPLQVSGRTIGVVYLDSNQVAGPFFRADVATVEALSAQAAVAIETARLYEDLRGKNELIGMLAHELRTPLTAILGFAEILEKIPTLTAEQRSRYLGSVQDHGDRMGRLIEQVLVLARLGADRVEWAFRPIELDALVVHTVIGLEPIAAARGVRLIVQADGTLPRVAGDADRLVQVLSNLISNAVSFSEKGTAVTITARAATMAAGATRKPVVEIRVRDEGPGILASEVPTLFEPFVQGGKRRDRGGAGLGLHICQTIVRRHGGSIWVETVRGSGSTFAFQVPVASAPDVPPRPAT